MLVTALNMYEATLEGINKERTSTVFPREFEFLINDAQLEWVKNKYYQVEEYEKRIEDLRVLKTRATLLPSSPNTFDLPYTAVPAISGNHGFLFMLSVEFKVNYVNNICGLTGLSGWLESKVIRSDQKSAYRSNPYKKPKDDKLYYEVLGNNLILVNDTLSTANSAQIDYIRYPRDILVDTVTQNSELPSQALQEIVNIAIRKYLETTEGNRYGTKSKDNSLLIN